MDSVLKIILIAVLALAGAAYFIFIVNHFKSKKEKYISSSQKDDETPINLHSEQFVSVIEKTNVTPVSVNISPQKDENIDLEQDENLQQDFDKFVKMLGSTVPDENAEFISDPDKLEKCYNEMIDTND